MTVRTRVAPSPTGDPHVGTAYIALFNKMFAQSLGGKFLLRVEDTDQVRSTPESEQAILDSLRWLGINWDEGPDIGGNYGPYRQSERRSIYDEHAGILLEKGHAFHCFCTSERLDEVRTEQMANKQMPGYDGHCLHLSKEDIDKNIADNKPYVLRMKVPSEGVCQVNDMLRGVIDINWSQIDMQVLVKADGMPTYHLANVVDDHLMKITHVIRGEEWINSAPKHQLLYEYFGWEMPVLCHMPLLRNPDKSKLSKRKNPTSITYYRDMGYLPEAVVNYLGRMGWSMPDEREKFTLEEMQQSFDISRVSLGGPVFDQEKLSWLNGSWIREDLSNAQFYEVLKGWLLNKEYLQRFLPFVKSRVNKLSDFASMSSFMFEGMLALKPEDFTHKNLDADAVKKVLQFVLWSMESLQCWNSDAIFNNIKQLANTLGFKIGDVMAPVFIAVAGTPNSWSVVDSMEILGADISRARLRHAVDILGGFSKKALKKLEKEYRL